MSGENGMETNCADSPSVEESIFGDGTDDATAADPVAESDNEETTQDGQDAGDKAAQNNRDADGEEASQSEELKVVVSIKGNRATIGVQRPSADPYIETFKDQDLSRLAQKVDEVNERAQARWEEGPKYPAYRRPVPAPTRRNRSPQVATNAEGESLPQPMTLRLF